MSEHILTFDNGTVGAIYDDAIAPILAEAGFTQTRRASCVEPFPGGWSGWGGWNVSIKPWVMRISRRRYPNLLPCEIVPGLLALRDNFFGPFATRGEALAAERAYLDAVL